MKKLLFSLLALVCSVSMMAEDVTLFSFETLATTTKDGVAANSSYEIVAGTDASISGGSATFINANSKATGAITTGNGHTGVAFGSGNHYLKIELTEALQEDDIIEVAAYVTDAAEVKINNAQSAGTATSGGKLIVTASSALKGATTIYICRNANTTRVESITITRPDPEAEKSDDATLSGISYNGAAVTGFDAATKTYNVTLAYGTTTKPTVTASAHEAHASIEITQPASVTGTATIDVTAQDETTTAQYTVNFSVSSEAPSIPDGYTAFHAAQNWDNITAANALYTVNGVSTFNLAVDNTSALDYEPELSGVTKRFNFGGTGAVDGRRIELPVEGPCTITVFGGNGNAGRSITISDGANALATVCETNAGNLNTIIKESYDYTGEAGTLYLYSTTSGYYVYAVGVTTVAPEENLVDNIKVWNNNVEYTATTEDGVNYVVTLPQGNFNPRNSVRVTPIATASVKDGSYEYPAGTTAIFNGVGLNQPKEITIVKDSEEKVYTITIAPNTEGSMVYTANVSASAKVSIEAGADKQVLTASEAYVVNGTMAVSNGQSSAKDLIAKQNGVMYFGMTNGNTFFTVNLDDAIKAGDIITATMSATGRGLIFSTNDTWSSDYPGAVAEDGTTISYTVQPEDDIVGATSFNVFRATGNSTYFNDFAINRPMEVQDRTLNADGLATFSFPVNTVIVGANAYTGKLSEDKGSLVLSKVEGGIVPAYTGVIIYGAKNGTYKALATEEEGTVDPENVILPTVNKATGGDVTPKPAGGALVLSGSTFVPYTSSVFGQYKAYLDKAVNELNSLKIVFEGEETAINAVASEAKVAKAIVVAENGKLLVKKADGSVVTIAGAVVK